MGGEVVEKAVRLSSSLSYAVVLRVRVESQEQIGSGAKTREGEAAHVKSHRTGAQGRKQGADLSAVHTPTTPQQPQRTAPDPQMLLRYGSLRNTSIASPSNGVASNAFRSSLASACASCTCQTELTISSAPRAQNKRERTIFLNCIPFSPSLSGFIRNKYASSPPTLSILLSAPAVTESLSFLPSASLQTFLLCRLGNHERRVLLLNVSPIWLPDIIERPS